MRVDLQCSSCIPPEWPAYAYHFGGVVTHSPEYVIMNVGVRRDGSKSIEELFRRIFVIDITSEYAIKRRTVFDFVPMKIAEVRTFSILTFDHIPRNKAPSASAVGTENAAWLGHPNYSLFGVTICFKTSHIDSLLFVSLSHCSLRAKKGIAYSLIDSWDGLTGVSESLRRIIHSTSNVASRPAPPILSNRRKPE